MRYLTLSRRVGLGGLVLMMLAGLAQAAPNHNLNTFQSRFYTVHTNLDRDEVKPIAHRMDVIFHHYRQRFNKFERRSRQTADLYLLRTRRQYVKFMGEYGVNAQNSGGMFFKLPNHGVHGLATWVQSRQQQRLVTVLQHEGFHQFAFHFIGQHIPIWVNEGLAQYFEDARIQGREMELGRVSKKRVRHLEQAYRQEKLLGLSKVLGLSMRQWNRILSASPRSSQRLYAQAWSMVYFLIHGENGKYREPFRRYLHLLAAGKTSRQAAEEAFQVETFQPMQRKWLRFLEYRLFEM
jgi:hypothetical protein